MALADELGALALQQQRVIGTAESCTGGLVAAALTAVSGSSAWFEQGLVTYSNEAKQRLLQVPEALLTAYGAVSEPVARAMALGVLSQYQGTHLAISTTGIAGPTGGSPAKPVGTVCFGFALRLATELHCETVLKHFKGDRDAVRQASVIYALEHARRVMLAYSL